MLFRSTILPLMLMEKMGAHLYEISIVYTANTITAFVIMNLMASKIMISNVTKFKIGIGLTVFVFIGLSQITEWWMAMPFMSLVGATWAFLFIGGNFHLMENNPKSTSTGIFSSTLSIATVIGPVIAGSIAFLAQEEIKQVAEENGFKVGNFIRRPIEGLLDYHVKNI